MHNGNGAIFISAVGAGAKGGALAPQFLPYQLTLSRPGRQIIPTKRATYHPNFRPSYGPVLLSFNLELRWVGLWLGDNFGIKIHA